MSAPSPLSVVIVDDDEFVAQSLRTILELSLIHILPVLQEERCVMGKCNLCAGRLDQGKDPFCVQACPTRIRKVGLISDPESEVSKLIAEHNAQPYKPENDTSPSVYYILP